MNNENNNILKTKKNNRKYLIILSVIIILLFITGFTILKLMNNNSNENIDNNLNNNKQDSIDGNQNTDSNNSDNEFVELSTTDEIVNKLMENVKTPTMLSHNIKDGYYYVYFYLKDKITIETMDNQMKLLLGFQKLNFPNKVTSETLKNALTEIFGKNISYFDEEMNIYVCPKYEYNNNIYTAYSGCGGAFFPKYDKKIVKSLKYNNKIEIYEQVIYIKYKFINNEREPSMIELYNADTETKLGETSIDSNQDNFEIYKDKLSTYKYTFNLEDGNYYFYSVEKVK